MYALSMAQHCLITQSNRLDPACKAAHAVAIDHICGGSAVSEAGGGNMDDVTRRVGAVETDICAMKMDLAAIKAVVPHLATKADLSDMKASIIQWLVATTIAVAAAAFSVAKFVH
jgi:hypothetical protein